MPKRLWIILGLLMALNLGLLRDLARVPPAMQLHMLDVGQGDALLLVSPEQHHILVDGGPGNAVLMELSAVMPQLWRDIDLLVLTHPHADHIEGLIPVLQRFEVQKVLLSMPAYETLAAAAFLHELEGMELYFAEAGMSIEAGSVHIDVLAPLDTVTDQHMDNINNASSVLRVEGPGAMLLLTGDAEQEVEAELLAAGVDLRADVLKMGHHGSRTSSTWGFLDAVGAQLFLVSAGTGNSYAHPHPETLEKAEALGVELLRTDVHGRVSLVFGPQTWWRSILAPSWRSFSSKEA